MSTRLAFIENGTSCAGVRRLRSQRRGVGANSMGISLQKRLPPTEYSYGTRRDGGTHGVVLTKPHVVGLILDLAGYSPDKDLAALRLLEPSCGHGAFLVQAVDRLLVSATHFGHTPAALKGAIRAYDIDASSVTMARTAVVKALKKHGLSTTIAAALASHWIRAADFLLTGQSHAFDVVVGNPPYIRIEQISPSLQAEYRRRYASIFDRADLYVAFIEHGLNLLSPLGVLSFICADRWILNKYGAPLRALLAERFSVRCYVDLHRAAPFESDVIAYPSIFAISAGSTRGVQVCKLEAASPEECASLSKVLLGGTDRGEALPSLDELDKHERGHQRQGVTVSVYDTWFQGDEPWVLSSPEQLAVLRELERKYEPIEATAAVGIGVATGNDKIFIVENTADIEPDRLVPLVMRGDIAQGRVSPTSKCVLNTFGDDGKVVDLQRYPRLQRYLNQHVSAIKQRHVAHKNPNAWFRTIDRVYPQLVAKPKLLIPDIAGSNEVVFEAGHYHPHHNLYFVTSDIWDLEILGGLLSSSIALFFVWSYAVKMRGGYLRFQAQYLRRIRLPDPNTIDRRLGQAIKSAFRRRKFKQLDILALRAYRLEKLPLFDFTDTRG